ncbi:winged helix-turn-helix domain-containing protein [Puniceicoccaceae bacterium K14]|nr:winged helix-turn-helix domain-containing protein [Puniceicoccaceae bacterium K14]
MKADSYIIAHMKVEALSPKPATSQSSSWTFFSNHAHVLLSLYRNPDSTLRDVANQVGITERAVQKIVAELEAANVLSKTKVGRCNRYSINKKKRLRHAIESHRNVGDLLRFIETD